MTKKILAVVLAAALLLTCGILVFAEGTTQTITVEFDANSGTGTMDAIEVVDGKIIVPECTITKDLYEFDGWNTRADGSGKSFEANEELLIEGLFAENDPELEILNNEGKITLYAQWLSENAEDFEEYYIYYDANGGEGVTEDTESYMAGFSALTALNEFTYGDYVFYHWNTKSDNSGEVYDEFTEITFPEEGASDITLYAIWRDPATGYLVYPGSDEINGGTDTEDPTNTDVEAPAETKTDVDDTPGNTDDTTTNTDTEDTYENIETVIPQTGDASSIAIALAAGAVAMGALVVLKKKD